MTNNWAIVAIPEKDDSVWKYSSEKVPHLTILSLGEHEAGPLSAKILSYLEHACEVMLHRFSMYSDERTELGPKKADVILFEKTRADQAIVQFRDALLKDPDVLEWFHTSPQFPEWTPHLTMGFPETPAPEDTRDYPGTHSVRFDRIALWTGDYDGPEIKLKSYEPTDLLMSDIRTSIDLSQKVTDIDVLHRPMAEFDETKVKRGKGGKFATKATISDTDANLVEDDLAWEQGDSQKFIKEYMISTNAKALEALAKKTLVPLGYKVDDSWESDPKAVAAVSKNAVAYMNKMASTQGTNPSGTKRISYSLKGNDLVTSVVSYSGPKPASPYRPPTLPIKKFDTGLPKHKSGPMFNPAATIDTSRISDASDAKHSDLIDQLDLSQTLVHATTGPSVQDIPGISLDQTMGEMEITPNLELMHFLEHHDMELVMLDGAEWVAVTDAVHFGRKGMKWGVRHKRGSDGTVTDSVSSDAQQVAALKAKVAKAGGTHTLTNDELTTLKKRISLENEYAKATGTDKSTLDRRHAKIKKAVDLGKTANDLYSFYNSDVGKMLRSLVMDVPDGSSGGGGKKGGGEKDNSNTQGSGGSKKGRGPRSQGPARTKLLYDATRLGRTSPGFSSPYKATGNPFIRPARKRHTVRGVVYGVTDLK